jgi:hypothetical protein
LELAVPAPPRRPRDPFGGMMINYRISIQTT